MTIKPVISAVGFNKFVGLELVEWNTDYACIALEMDEHHLNGLDIAHGGVLLSALDAACGMSGCYSPPPEERRYSMTISLTTNFVRPLRNGQLRAIARRVGGGKTVFFSEGKIVDTEGELVASATGTFRYLRNKPSI